MVVDGVSGAGPVAGIEWTNCLSILFTNSEVMHSYVYSAYSRGLIVVGSGPGKKPDHFVRCSFVAHLTGL